MELQGYGYMPEASQAQRNMKSLLYAHEGCYLSLPDDRYQTHDSPFFDEELVKKETRLLKEEIAGAAAFGCTGFVHLMAGIEDFISYRFMNHPQADRREVRARGLSRALRELIMNCSSIHGLRSVFLNPIYIPFYLSGIRSFLILPVLTALLLLLRRYTTGGAAGMWISEGFIIRCL
jgi:hypothetical protein